MIYNTNQKIINILFQDPYHELLLWAVLSQRNKLARFLWERCNSPLIAGITASCLFRKLWLSLGAKNTDLRKTYLEQKENFEMLSVGVS